MAHMASFGSAEPYQYYDGETDEVDGKQLNSVPAYPKQSSLSSPSHDATASPFAHRREDPKSSSGTSPGKSNATSPVAPQKRKSIGSKFLAKLKPGHAAGGGHTDGRQAPHDASGDQSTSSTDEYDDFVQASKLKDALHDEQRRRHLIQQQSAKSGGAPGHRQASLDTTAQSTETVQPSRYRQNSDASKHFPGDIFESRRKRTPAASREHDDTLPTRSAPPAEKSADLSDLDEDGQDIDEIMDELQRNSLDSEASDDTLTHLIREAEGYDALRYGKNGELSSVIDFDTLHAVHESEVSAGSDARSSQSGYSGGASKALSKPLLELEDIELERFLKTFARHTRQATVMHTSDKHNRRMPQWSDFRQSVPESPNGEAPTLRPTMLAKVDRSLRHLSDGLQSTALDRSPIKLPRKESETGEQRSGHLDMEDDESLHPDTSNAEDEPDSPSPSPKKSKGRFSKKTKQPKPKQKKKKDGDDDHENEWDLVSASGTSPAPDRKPVSAEDLHVSAQDEGVDGVAFCIAYILALVEILAPEEIDHHPDHGYREGLIRSHLERLYTIAPFWEQLGSRVRGLYRWEDPKTTAAAAMIYFVLWYNDMIPTAFLLTIMFYIMRFKYFPPSESYLHEKVKQRMARGQAANTLSDKLRRRSRLDILTIYKRWAAAYGAPTQEAMGMIADFHEKVKNLILWRNAAATRRTLILFGALNLLVTFTPAHYVYKTGFFGLGITFFCLLPLQSYFPSHRKALSPLWWATFGAPTDAQFAVQILRKRHLDIDKFAGKSRTADDVRRAVQNQKGARVKPRADRREDGIQWDQLEDRSRAGQDYVGNSRDADYKPRKLGSYFCQYKGLPGRLHINTKYLYFTPLHSPAQKRGHTALEAIESLVKTKNIRLGFWNSLGLKIARNNGKAPMLLANVQHRDDAFNLILAVSTGAD